MNQKHIQMKHRSGDTEYDVFPITKADLVEETADKTFVTANEKEAWNNKAEAVHPHDEYINKTGDTMSGTLIANDIEISGALKINGKRISIGSSAHSSPSSGDIWIQV